MAVSVHAVFLAGDVSAVQNTSQKVLRKDLLLSLHCQTISSEKEVPCGWCASIFGDKRKRRKSCICSCAKQIPLPLKGIMMGKVIFPSLFWLQRNLSIPPSSSSCHPSLSLTSFAVFPSLEQKPFLLQNSGKELNPDTFSTDPNFPRLNLMTERQRVPGNEGMFSTLW